MKAIAHAPEKLYLIQDNGLVCYCRNTDEDIEYIRTDTFIDKACEFIKDHHHEFSFWNTEEYELGFSTQKFIDDFKNYMKGE